MNKLIKLLISSNLLVAPIAATAADLYEGDDYKEYSVDFDHSSAVQFRAFGETYRSGYTNTLVSIKKVDASLYVVNQQPIYHTMEAVYPPLPILTRVDQVKQIIRKPSDFRTVRILVPTSLNVEVKGINVNRPPNVCMAYWTGYVFDPTTNSCVQRGTSGCTNPFPFTTLKACMDAND